MANELMSDADFELFINNWPPESAAQLRVMPYPHDWNFVVSSLAEWWVGLTRETEQMLTRVFPSERERRYRVEVVSIMGGGKNDVYIFTSADPCSVEDVRSHAHAYYTAQNIQPERVEVDVIEPGTLTICAATAFTAKSHCKACFSHSDCFFHAHHPEGSNT